MPLYTYRREDGTTFEVRQAFADDPLMVDPATGQAVQRVVQAAGIIFKGSGFYVTDNGRKAANSARNGADGTGGSDAPAKDANGAPAEGGAKASGDNAPAVPASTPTTPVPAKP